MALNGSSGMLNRAVGALHFAQNEKQARNGSYGMKSRSFVVNFDFLESRTLLSHPSSGAIAELGHAQRGQASAPTLQLKGVMPAGFPFRGIPHPGSPILSLILGGKHQTLTANGTKVQMGDVESATGAPVAIYGGPSHLEFSENSTMTLQTRKGTLVLDLTPLAAGGDSLYFRVSSGTGRFATAYGTGTVTFTSVAKFHSNR